jgi:nicotinamide-nucleotide amidase
MKKNLLGVKAQTLKVHGAVSEETVLEMLDGVLKATGAAIGVSVSGIAGPGGGSVEKPVGTIWLAWGNKEKKKTRKLQLSKDRLKNIEYTSVAAMNSLRLFLTEL